MTAMPRPHRRRREKKLMSMDEVNERFPLKKYKAWRSSREHEGLPAAGGITANPSNPSRPGSMKEEEDVRSSGDNRKSEEVARPSTALSVAREDYAIASAAAVTHQPEITVEGSSARESDDKAEQERVVELEKVKTAASTVADTSEDASEAHDHDADDSDDDDPIRTATAPEMLAQPGDTCAICETSSTNDAALSAANLRKRKAPSANFSVSTAGVTSAKRSPVPA